MHSIIKQSLSSRFIFAKSFTGPEIPESLHLLLKALLNPFSISKEFLLSVTLTKTYGSLFHSKSKYEH